MQCVCLLRESWLQAIRLQDQLQDQPHDQLQGHLQDQLQDQLQQVTALCSDSYELHDFFIILFTYFNFVFRVEDPPVWETNNFYRVSHWDEQSDLDDRVLRIYLARCLALKFAIETQSAGQSYPLPW